MLVSGMTAEPTTELARAVTKETSIGAIDLSIGDRGDFRTSNSNTSQSTTTRTPTTGAALADAAGTV